MIFPKMSPIIVLTAQQQVHRVLCAISVIPSYYCSPLCSVYSILISYTVFKSFWRVLLECHVLMVNDSFQVVFIAGILTGVSLMIAGSVLRGQKRGGDLMVLVYIGCLTVLVCTLLLSVQCCVRRDVKRRKRARGLRPPAPIPLHDLAPQAEPLVHHLITASQSGHNQRYIHDSLIRSVYLPIIVKHLLSGVLSNQNG